MNDISYICSECKGYLKVREEKTNTEGYSYLIVEPCEFCLIDPHEEFDIGELEDEIEDLKDKVYELENEISRLRDEWE